MTPIYASLTMALMLWTLMFSPFTAPHIEFWPVMSTAAVILLGCVFHDAPGWWKQYRLKPVDILLGISLAVGLWGIFWVGNIIATHIFPFAGREIQAVYLIKEDANPVLLTLLLVLLIGPAEEIFWRGYVQRKLSETTSANMGYILATLFYTAIHLPSCNMMLVMASLVAGGIWGLVYRIIPHRLPGLVISHGVWDAMVLIWLAPI